MQHHLQGAHLVGSLNLLDAATTFRTVSEHLGDRLRRIPDGEVGERFYWIQFQSRRFDETAGLSRIPIEPIMLRDTFDGRPFFLEPGVDPSELVFPSLGYADAAIDSYREFVRLRSEGVIAQGVRFQVSLPTPAAVVGAFIVADSRAVVEPAYESALFAEVDRITSQIPHDDLAIQWDTAVEFALLEATNIRSHHAMSAWFPDVMGGVVERAVRQAARVPLDVELGYHLCYGDVEEAHFVQPKDAGFLATFIVRLLEMTPRPISWIHLPVPIERDDAEYFEPLSRVTIPEETELYLGLIHHEDGVEGAQRRAAAASAAQSRFGVATECGFGRGPRDRTPMLLDLHAAVASSW